MTYQLSSELIYVFIYASCGLGFLYGIMNWIIVRSVEVSSADVGSDTERQNVSDTDVKMIKSTADKIKLVLII